MNNSKKLFALILTAASAGASASTAPRASSKIDPALVTFGRSQSQQTATVIAVMDLPLDKGMAVPARYDLINTKRFLRYRAAKAFNAVNEYLIQTQALNKTVHIKQVFAVNLSMSLQVTPAGLRTLAQAPGVTKIYANRKVNLEPRIRGFVRSRTDDVPTTPTNAGGIPYDFVATHLDALIKEAPQFTGTGVLIGQVDTGVDGSHPALAGKVVGFYNGATDKRGLPAIDFESHGTHTAGTMVGGDRTKLFIGIAPGAKLITAGALANYEQMLKGMEFILDPEGNANSAAAPRVVSNSWNCNGAPDVELFYRGISAWESAGILPVFSAGNSGPGNGTITPPHEDPDAFAIGSTGKTNIVSQFSSRGPGMFRGQPTQKPDITAPGENIYSSVPKGQFEMESGTSMATPHVTGTVALILQANPKLNPAQVRAVLLQSATPTDANGNPGPAGVWNANYGFGELNIEAAVKLALQSAAGPSPFSFRNGLNASQEMLFSAPVDVSLDAITNSTSNKSVMDSFAFPAEMEGQNWASLGDL